MEIRKLASSNLDSVSMQSAPYMSIYDQNDCPVLLHEDMNFDCIYKVQFSGSAAKSAVNNAQPHTYGPYNNLFQAT